MNTKNPEDRAKKLSVTMKPENEAYVTERSKIDAPGHPKFSRALDAIVREHRDKIGQPVKA